MSRVSGGLQAQDKASAAGLPYLRPDAQILYWPISSAVAFGVRGVAQILRRPKRFVKGQLREECACGSQVTIATGTATRFCVYMLFHIHYCREPGTRTALPDSSSLLFVSNRSLEVFQTVASSEGMQPLIPVPCLQP